MIKATTPLREAEHTNISRYKEQRPSGKVQLRELAFSDHISGLLLKNPSNKKEDCWREEKASAAKRYRQVPRCLGENHHPLLLILG